MVATSNATFAQGATAFDWTGFTIGAHGGWNRSKLEFPAAPEYPAGPPRPELDGAFVGGQLGFNYQFGQFVLGGVADYSRANIEKSVKDGNYLVETARMDRMGSLRAILGFSFGQFLPYATAGIATARVTYGASCPDQAAVPFGLCSRAGPRGYEDTNYFRGRTFGGGVKYMLGRNAIVGVEYLRTSFSDTEFTNGPISTFPAVAMPLDTTLNQVRMTVDFKF